MTDPIFWSQVWALTVANLKSRYRKTLAGFLWVILNPVIMFGVQSLVFKKFLKLQVNNYSLFLVSGLLPWIFIVQTLEMCCSIFVASGPLLKSIRVPPLVYLFSQICDCLINFVAAFLAILVPVLIFHQASVSRLLLLPLPLLLIVVAVSGMALILATLQVFMRDTRFILTFVIQIAFFLTPIFYPIQFVPDKYRWMISINPIYHLIWPFRAALYDFEWGTFLSALGAAALTAVAFAGLSIWIWRRKKNAVYFHI